MSPYERMADLVARVVNKPRTSQELSELLETDRKIVVKCLKALESEGVVQSERAPFNGRKGNRPIIWMWTA